MTNLKEALSEKYQEILEKFEGEKGKESTEKAETK